MKPFHENDLIAYHLNELSSRRTRALEKALQRDPALAAESEAYGAMLRSFKADTPLDVDEEILDRNWDRIWSNLPRQSLRPVPFRRWLVPVLAGAGIVFAATSSFLTAHRHEAAPSRESTQSPNGMAQSAPPVDAPFAAGAVPEGSNTDRQREPQKSLRPVSPRKPSMLQLHTRSSHLIASLSLDHNELEPPLQFMPLARVSTLLPTVIGSQPPSVPQVSKANPDSQSRRKSVHRNHPMDLTLAMGGVLIGTRDINKNGVTSSQGASPAVSAIASFHQQIRQAVGYRVTVSYARPDFSYDSGTGQTYINGRIYEVAGTYVVQGPHRGIVSTTVEGGAGLMTILPTVKSADTGKNMRGAAIAGVSAEFAVSKHLAIHTGYRMQVFSRPDFQSTGKVVPTVTTTLFSNEPMVGITYRFAHD